VNVNFGLKTLFLLGAAVVFALAVFVDDISDFYNLIGWGLAAFAFAFVIADLGWDRRYGSRRGP
jgi:hypothetical protein